MSLMRTTYYHRTITDMEESHIGGKFSLGKWWGNHFNTSVIFQYDRIKVAPEFQKMIRAEAGAQPPGATLAISKTGEPKMIRRKLGQVVCVTCGKVGPWKGGVNRFSGMHTGHFLASRRASILLDPANVAVQCSSCNVFRDGAQQEFRNWMLLVRGEETVSRLERQKNTIRKFTYEELVDMLLEFRARIKAAEEKILFRPSGS